MPPTAAFLVFIVLTLETAEKLNLTGGVDIANDENPLDVLQNRRKYYTLNKTLLL